MLYYILLILRASPIVPKKRLINLWIFQVAKKLAYFLGSSNSFQNPSLKIYTPIPNDLLFFSLFFYIFIENYVLLLILCHIHPPPDWLINTRMHISTRLDWFLQVGLQVEIGRVTALERAVKTFVKSGNSYLYR